MTSPYRLEAVQLQGVGVFDNTLIRFKPIESAEQDEKLAEIHLFTGPNGCGKSTLLYSLAEIFDGAGVQKSLIMRRFRSDKSRVDYLFAGDNEHYVSEWESPLAEGIYFTDKQFGKPLLDMGIAREYTYSAKHALMNYRVSKSRFELNHIQVKFSFATFAYSGQRTLRSEPMVSIKEITNSPFDAAHSFDSTLRVNILLQWIAKNRVQFELAKSDNDSTSAATYDLALNRITGLIRDVCDMEVEFRLERSPLAVTVKVNGDTIQFDGLPDGLKSIISWVADLSLRLEAIPWEVEQDIFSQPIILFLDEVDIHLHPKWQRRILPAIQKLLPNAQIFVTTHSPFVVGSVENAWVYRLPEPGTKTDGVMEIEGIPSGAGKSYRLILNEIFGIDKEFDIETEALFDDFYQARAVFLKTPTNADEVIKIAGQLADRGEEAAAIVSRELRQMSRVTGVEVSLA